MSDTLRQTDLREALDKLTESNLTPLDTTRHRYLMNELLRHFASKRIPLAVCADARHLNRNIKTLKQYCRDLGLSFPDYTPKALREKPGV